MGSNRNSITHENSSIAITIEEIKIDYENCIRAFQIVDEYINNIKRN